MVVVIYLCDSVTASVLTTGARKGTDIEQFQVRVFFAGRFDFGWRASRRNRLRTRRYSRRVDVEPRPRVRFAFSRGTVTDGPCLCSLDKIIDVVGADLFLGSAVTHAQ